MLLAATVLQFGLGRSFSSFSPEDKVKYLQTGLANNFFYVFALTFVKISILFLYLRAFTYPFVLVASKVLLGIVIITHLWIIISVATTCIPLDALWNLAKRSTAYCHPFSVWWSHTGINITTDLLIFALPLTVLRKMRVPKRQKTALHFVFGLGFWCEPTSPPLQESPTNEFTVSASYPSSGHYSSYMVSRRPIDVQSSSGAGTCSRSTSPSYARVQPPSNRLSPRCSLGSIRNPPASRQMRRDSRRLDTLVGLGNPSTALSGMLLSRRTEMPRRLRLGKKNPVRPGHGPVLVVDIVS